MRQFTIWPSCLVFASITALFLLGGTVQTVHAQGGLPEPDGKILIRSFTKGPDRLAVADFRIACQAKAIQCDCAAGTIHSLTEEPDVLIELCPDGSEPYAKFWGCFLHSCSDLGCVQGP